MFITNEKGASGFGFHWAPGEVVEVPDDIAAELVAIQDAGFTVAPEPKVAAKAAPKRKVNTEVEKTHTDTNDM